MSVAKSLPSCARCGADLPAEGADCPKCAGSEPRANEVIAGKYKLERLLGRGGMGTVHLATDLTLERPCALKLLRASLASEEDIVARFEKEARMLARLEHPNIVPIYAVERDGKVPFIVMKYLEGRTLSQLRRDMGRPWTAQELSPIVRQFCAGLGFMHQKGVVHRDLKPGNLFVSGDGQCTILDLGIARDHDSTLTRPGLPMGTPHYMSPEQTATTKIDARSDLYSFGVILYEALTGQLPFPGESEFDLMRAHRETPPPDASTVARVAPLMGKLLQRAMAKAPHDRYQTAKELADAWEVGAGAPTPEAAPAGTPAPAPKPSAATPAGPAAVVATPLSKPGIAIPPPAGAVEKKVESEPAEAKASPAPESSAAPVDPNAPVPLPGAVALPGAEAPKAEAPKAEAPKADAPKVDAAKPAATSDAPPRTDPNMAAPEASPAVSSGAPQPELPVSKPMTPMAAKLPVPPKPELPVSKPPTPMAAKPEVSKPLTPLAGKVDAPKPEAARPFTPISLKSQPGVPKAEVSKPLTPLAPKASAPSAAKALAPRPSAPPAATPELPASKPTTPIHPRTSAPPAARLSRPGHTPLPPPRTSAPPPKPGPPVDDDPPTPVPDAQGRFPQAGGAELGDDDPFEKTAMVPSPLMPAPATTAQVVALDGAAKRSDTSASDTLSGDDDDGLNPFADDKTSVIAAEQVSAVVKAPQLLPEPSAALPVGPAGTVDSTGSQSITGGGNPWQGAEATASTVTPGEDFARRPTTESPLAQLSTLAQRPIVWVVGGGVLLLLLITVVVLLLRPAVPAAGSIIEVKQPPRPAWRNDELPTPPPPALKAAEQKPRAAPEQKVAEQKPPPDEKARDVPAVPPPETHADDKPEKPVKAAAKKSNKPGELRVVVTAKGKAIAARVSIDGGDRGYSPLVVKLPAGTHEVVVTRPKAPPAARQVKITAEKSTVAKFELD